MSPYKEERNKFEILKIIILKTNIFILVIKHTHTIHVIVIKLYMYRSNLATKVVEIIFSPCDETMIFYLKSSFLQLH